MSYSTQDESDYSVPSESEEEFAPQQPKARGKKAASNKLTINDLSDTDVEPVKQKTTASNGRSVVPKKNANKKQATLAESLDSGAGSAAATPISAATAASSNSDRPVEEIYQKKSQLEHILLRPDTYIGSVEPITETMWVYNDAEERMVQEAITYSPGLYKIVDEILVNAADNKIRDSSMDTIKVTANKDTGVISVYNNGKGIPVQIHSKEGVYVPELIFGHLLTSSNYNDNQKKVTGGRNGYGAKLCNIFSVEFIVETADASTGKKYRQVFKNNMSVIGKPSITAHKNKSEWTKITFKPDFGKFHMQGLEDGIYELIRRRVYDLAGCVKRVKVYFNEKRISINSFKKYAELYLKSPAKVVKDEASGNASDSDVSVVPSKPKPIANYVHEVFNDRWEVIIAVSEGQFHQVSFVNSINTVKGGTHVNHVVDQVTTKVIESISKKNKKQILRPYQVKNYLWVFVNSLIENAAFDSQTKETLTLRQNAFGSRCEVSDAFITKLLKSTDLNENVLSFVKFKEEQQLKKTDGKRFGRVLVPKLEDANLASNPKTASQCTLILTEGDSAKALAVAGLGVVGRARYGVFPLRGKLLNVRDASSRQISENAEFTNLKKILGLKQGAKYDSVKDLRYGKVMIMADQDTDGSHIKGLIINLFDTFYPELLKISGFLQEFITPVLVATKKSNKKVKEMFFSEQEYLQWRNRMPDKAASWDVKYYKGLGTSSDVEGRQYFRNLDFHCKSFAPITPEERAMLDLVFNKKRADNRKEWLRTYQPNIYMDNTPEVIRIDDFINKELITFSVADNIRSIPSVIDGFKPAQRKVIYGCFKRKLKGQIKVTSLAGYVLENVAYHHGEQSLQATIINLAQHFVGSSNINVLTPEGQLGTRLMGGKDAASARYVQVSLPKLTRSIYHSSDDMLLKYLDDEGKIIEPEFFVPVVPMVLVNGTEGIGTGWSTNIPSYNPTDIVANIRRMMRGEEPLPMDPWFRGFQGTIEKISPDKYRVSGNIAKISDDTLHITELPIRMWTDNYVAMLNQWRTGTEKEPPIIKDFVDNHTHTIIDFELKLTPEQMHKAEAEGFEKRFKLTTQISTTNFVCFDHQGRLHKYESTQEIFREFYQYRLKFYQLRKEYLANQLQRDYVILDNKARFVLEIIEKKLIVQNRKKDVLIKELRDRGYAPFSDKKPSVSTTAVIENPEDDNQERESDDEAASLEVPESKRDKDYDYLLSMPIWNLTYERFQKLLQERDERVKVLETLLAKAPEDLWNEDLDEFMKNWEGNLEEDAKILEEEWEEHLIALSGGSAKGKSKAAAAKKAKKSSNTEIKRRARELAQQQQRTITPASDLVDVKPKVALKSEANIGALATPAPAPPASASTTANTSAVPAGDAPGKRKQGTLDGFIKSKDGGDISLYDSSDSDDLPVLNFRERLEKRKAERNKLKQGSAETAGAGDDNNDPSAPSVANTGGDSKPASTGADTGRKKRQPLDTASLPKSRATASKPGRSNSTTATTTATIKNKGKKRSAKILESDSEGSGVDSTGEFEVDKPKSVAVSRPARGARATTAKSAPTYLEISDDDSDGGKFKDNDDDDDDASFNDDYSE